MLKNLFRKKYFGKRGALLDFLFWLIVTVFIIVIVIIAIMILFGKGSGALSFIKDWLTGG